VQDWYRNGSGMGRQSPFDWRYRYITANIRAGSTQANSSPVRPPLQRLQPGATLAAM